jgi:hypothetical protein
MSLDRTKVCLTVTCMKRWGLRASSLSAVTKADAGQNVSDNHLNPNVLYMMLAVRFYFNLYLCRQFVIDFIVGNCE